MVVAALPLAMPLATSSVSGSDDSENGVSVQLTARKDAHEQMVRQFSPLSLDFHYEEPCVHEDLAPSRPSDSICIYVALHRDEPPQQFDVDYVSRRSGSLKQEIAYSFDFLADEILTN